MRNAIFAILLFLFLCPRLYATVTIRRDRDVEYMIVYYATVYTVTTSRDKDVSYIIIPGDFDSDDFEFSYDIAPDLYPVSSGLIYRWRVQNNEWHRKFRKQRDVNAKKEY